MRTQVSFLKTSVFIAVFLILFVCTSAFFPKIGTADMISDGSDGPFHPLQNTTIDLYVKNLFNFTTITIPEDVKVSFINSVDNAPVYFLATDDIIIDGVLDLRGGLQQKWLAGPGGYEGGSGGSDSAAGMPGFGPGGGYGGIARHPGGGASFATLGTSTKIDGCLSVILPPAPAVPYTLDLFDGGSGGGGGGGGAFGVLGCSGGGGGGAVFLSTPFIININGDVIASGASGANCYTSALCGIRGGPGGGGSGGTIRLEANTVIIEPNGTLNCRGGYGGVRSLDGSLTPYGGNGGYGYIVIESSFLDLRGVVLGSLILNGCIVDFDNDGDVDGSDVLHMASNVEPACLICFAKSFGSVY